MVLIRIKRRGIKKMKKRNHFIIGSIVLVTVSIFSLLLFNQLASAQNNSVSINESDKVIINEITQDLIRKNIPIVSGEIISDPNWNPPFIVEYILRSLSDSETIAPDDPININTVFHETNLLDEKGLNAGAVGISLVNNEDKIIFHLTEAMKNNNEIPFKPDSVKLGKDIISDNLDDVAISGGYIEKIDISEDAMGYRNAKYYIRVLDIESVNLELLSIIKDTRTKADQINTQGGQLASIQLVISSYDGHLLFNHITDLQFGGIQRWWQDNYVTEDWIPHPVSR
jgi:hypothetical protein